MHLSCKNEVSFDNQPCISVSCTIDGGNHRHWFSVFLPGPLSLNLHIYMGILISLFFYTNNTILYFLKLFKINFIQKALSHSFFRGMRILYFLVSSIICPHSFLSLCRITESISEFINSPIDRHLSGFYFFFFFSFFLNFLFFTKTKLLQRIFLCICSESFPRLSYMEVSL